MRMALALVVAATACGRVGFDRVSHEDADLGSNGSDGSDGANPLCPAFALLCDDFESGTAAKWSGVSLSPLASGTVSTTRSHSGQFAFDANVPSNTGIEFSTVYLKIIPAQTTGVIAIREWIYATAPFGSFDMVVGLFNNPADKYFVFGCDNSDNWTATERSTTTGTDDHLGTLPCAPNVWTCVEMVYSLDARHATLYVNDAAVLDVAVLDPAPQFDDIELGALRADSAGFRIFVDDAVIATQRIGCQ
jgi:hypothetical protein